MFSPRYGAVTLLLALSAAPAAASSFITDPIVDPSEQWAGIDYWGVQVSQFSTLDQTLTFGVSDDSKIDIFMQGSPKFQFSDILLNGVSIASNFTLGNTTSLTATGYAHAGSVALTFQGDYNCGDCWGDWFGGYVQVTKEAIPPQIPARAVPEPASWALMIGGFGLAGAMMRRRRKSVRFV